MREGRWQTAALLSDRARRAIRERLLAGEAVAALANDYQVPRAFVARLGQWQLFGDEPVMPRGLRRQNGGHRE